ncbi:hypothetical protein [Dehalococcoides mccartyi]|nr:hypothetical protein [Dehalococcoides mccartyi]
MEKTKLVVPAKIPGLLEALTEEDTFPDDLKYIMARHEIGPTTIARVYGICRMQVYRWLRGEGLPREPAIYASVKTWAKELRESAKAS